MTRTWEFDQCRQLTHSQSVHLKITIRTYNDMQMCIAHSKCIGLYEVMHLQTEWKKKIKFHLNAHEYKYLKNTLAYANIYLLKIIYVKSIAKIKSYYRKSRSTIFEQKMTTTKMMMMKMKKKSKPQLPNMPFVFNLS